MYSLRLNPARTAEKICGVIKPRVLYLKYRISARLCIQLCCERLRVGPYYLPVNNFLRGSRVRGGLRRGERKEDTEGQEGTACRDTIRSIGLPELSNKDVTLLTEMSFMLPIHASLLQIFYI